MLEVLHYLNPLAATSDSGGYPLGVFRALGLKHSEVGKTWIMASPSDSSAGTLKGTRYLSS
jgi:hypothetical protein